jgi:hypothetical protein
MYQELKCDENNKSALMMHRDSAGAARRPFGLADAIPPNSFDSQLLNPISSRSPWERRVWLVIDHLRHYYQYKTAEVQTQGPED